jgi:hypothetical protein
MMMRTTRFALAALLCSALTTTLTTAAAAPRGRGASLDEEPPGAGARPSGELDGADEDAAAAEAPAGSADPEDDEATAPNDVADLRERVEQLEDIVQDLERKAAAQRLGWSADYRVTLSSFRYRGDALDGSRQPDGAPRQVDLRNNEQWTHRVRLSIQAAPSSKLRFRARLVAFKRFGDTSFTPLLDAAQSRVPHDAAARFDRFWLDWFATDRLSLSLGRISTSDGSPAELRENLEQPAASISLGFTDAEFDAIAMTYRLGSLLLRTSYISLQFQRPDDPFGMLPFLAKDETPVRIYAASLLVRSSGGALPTAELSAYINPRFRSIYPLPPVLGPDGTPLRPTSSPRSFGKLGAGSLLLLWRELLPGLDLFTSASVSFADPNGEAIEYPLGPGGASVPVFALVGHDADTQLGYQLYGGLRYRLPFGGVRAPKLGFEATHGSRYLVLFTTPTSDLVTRIGVRGDTYDAYYIQPIYANLFARLSYTRIDYSHSPPLGGGLGLTAPFGGTAPEARRLIQGVNLLLHASF